MKKFIVVNLKNGYAGRISVRVFLEKEQKEFVLETSDVELLIENQIRQNGYKIVREKGQKLERIKINK